jgi:hypothetical protein
MPEMSKPTPPQSRPTEKINHTNHTEDLAAEALLMDVLGASVVSATDIGTHAIELAVNGYPVLPLRGKIPAIPNPHPRGSWLRQNCRGECGSEGHGVLDATTDPSTVARWWGGRYRGCNVGARVLPWMFVIDIDPRSGGDASIAVLETVYGSLPETLTTISGRGDGGRHLFFRRPAGDLTARHLGSGIDLKTDTGYTVHAPSIHPDTGQPYERIDRPVADPPRWLIELMRPQHVAATPRAARQLVGAHAGPSIADQFSHDTSWADVLTPHGWQCVDADPDADDARWRHPKATSPASATVRHGLLFVYSPNTPFEVTEHGRPNGYTKFRAYSILEHGGDMSAAARALAVGE